MNIMRSEKPITAVDILAEIRDHKLSIFSVDDQYSIWPNLRVISSLSYKDDEKSILRIVNSVSQLYMGKQSSMLPLRVLVTPDLFEELKKPYAELESFYKKTGRPHHWYEDNEHLFITNTRGSKKDVFKWGPYFEYVKKQDKLLELKMLKEEASKLELELATR